MGRLASLNLAEAAGLSWHPGDVAVLLELLYIMIQLLLALQLYALLKLYSSLV